jgi:hypothetical protein
MTPLVWEGPIFPPETARHLQFTDDRGLAEVTRRHPGQRERRWERPREHGAFPREHPATCRTEDAAGHDRLWTREAFIVAVSTSLRRGTWNPFRRRIDQQEQSLTRTDLVPAGSPKALRGTPRVPTGTPRAPPVTGRSSRFRSHPNSGQSRFPSRTTRNWSTTSPPTMRSSTSRTSSSDFKGRGDSTFMGGAHRPGRFIEHANEELRRGQQIDAPLRHPLAREVIDVIGQHPVGISRERCGQDMAVLRIHVHGLDQSHVDRAHLENGVVEKCVHQVLEPALLLRSRRIRPFVRAAGRSSDRPRGAAPC